MRVVVGEQPDQPVALAEVDRDDLVAEGRPAPRATTPSQSARAWSSLVTTTARGIADLGALAPQAAGRRVDALVGGDHEHRAVGGPQPGAQLADEVGVAGGVEQVDLDVAVHQRRQGEPDRALLPVLGLVEVGDRRALDRRTGPGQHTGRDQERLDQCRLPGSGGPDEDHVADRISAARRRAPPPPVPRLGARRLACHVVRLLADTGTPRPHSTPRRRGCTRPRRPGRPPAPTAVGRPRCQGPRGTGVTMTGMRLDHLSYAAGPDGLASTARRLGELLGEPFVDGGIHPRFGTRNMVLPLCAGHLPRGRRRCSTTRPPTRRRSARRSGPAPSSAAAGSAGSSPSTTSPTVERRLGRESVAGNRFRPDGHELRWRQIGVKGLQSDPQLPFFVQWEGDGSDHPSGGASARHPPRVAWRSPATRTG